MVGLHRAVFGADRGALDQRQQIALHALAADVAAAETAFHRAGADLVDLVEEHDAVVLGMLERVLRQPVTVQQPIRLVAFQRRARRGHRHAPLLRRPAAEHVPHHVVQVDRLPGLHAGDFELADRHALRLADFDLDFPLVEFARAQHAAEFAARVGRRGVAGQGADQPFLGR